MLTTTQAVLLKKAIAAHDAANAQLGCGDPEPYDRETIAYLQAFRLAGGNDKGWQTWDDAKKALDARK